MASPLTPAFLAIRDLCRRDSRLRLRLPADVERATVFDATSVDITYAMTMRPLPPLLRPLHGGELILMPARIWPDVAGYVGNLMADLGRNGVAAIVLEPDHPLATRDLHENIAMITADATVDALLESHLNALIQNRGSDLYRLTTDLDRRLTGISAHADALPALLTAAAEVSGRGVLLTDTAGLPMALAGGATPGYVDELARQAARSHGRTLIVRASDSDGRLTAPVRTAEGVHGYLSLTAGRGGAGFTETDRLIAERTAYACSFALMRVGPVAPAVRQLGPTPAEMERSLRNLLLGKLETESAALAECRAIGLDPHRGAAVLLAAPPPDAESLGVLRSALEAAVASWQPRAYVMELAEVSAIAVLFPVVDGEASRRRAVEVGRRLAEESGQTGIAVGISDRHVGWRGIAQGFQQAYFALRLGGTAAVPHSVVDSGAAGDLGIYRLLYPLWQSDDLVAFSDEVLGGLLAYDEKRGGGLVQTLEAYLDLGGGMQDIADRLYIHRNSLIYRLRRIEELTGRVLADPHDRLLLHLALKVRQMPGAPPIRGSR